MTRKIWFENGEFHYIWNDFDPVKINTSKIVSWYNNIYLPNRHDTAGWGFGPIPEITDTARAMLNLLR